MAIELLRKLNGNETKGLNNTTQSDMLWFVASKIKDEIYHQIIENRRSKIKENGEIKDAVSRYKDAAAAAEGIQLFETRQLPKERVKGKCFFLAFLACIAAS